MSQDRSDHHEPRNFDSDETTAPLLLFGAACLGVFLSLPSEHAHSHDHTSVGHAAPSHPSHELIGEVLAGDSAESELEESEAPADTAEAEAELTADGALGDEDSRDEAEAGAELAPEGARAQAAASATEASARSLGEATVPAPPHLDTSKQAAPAVPIGPPRPPASTPTRTSSPSSLASAPKSSPAGEKVVPETRASTGAPVTQAATPGTSPTPGASPAPRSAPAPEMKAPEPTGPLGPRAPAPTE